MNQAQQPEALRTRFAMSMYVSQGDMIKDMQRTIDAQAAELAALKAAPAPSLASELADMLERSITGLSHYRDSELWSEADEEHINECNALLERFNCADDGEPAPAQAAPAAQAVEPDLPDVEDMAHSAVQEALAYGVSHDVFHRWMRAVMDKTVAGLRATPPAQAMERYCPECGHVGGVSAEHVNCCPDGSSAFMVPAKYAVELRAGFKALLAAPQAQDVQRDAFTHAELLELSSAADDFKEGCDTNVNHDLLARGAIAGFLYCESFSVINSQALEAAIAASAAKGGEA